MHVRRISQHPLFLKATILLAVLFLWEVTAKLGIFSSFIFPSISDTILYFFLNSWKLLRATLNTLSLLATGITIGSLIALSVASLAALSKKWRAALETYITVVGPIPAISMLPFAILWFGLGEKPIIFITVFGCLVPYMIAVVNGFQTMRGIYWDIGRMYGLSRSGLILKILVPASLPHILAGFRSGWSVGWRSVVAAELVFGAVGEGGGLGWMIYINRFLLNAPGMLAALICISLIGITAENILELIEKRTVKRWGMKV